MDELPGTPKATVGISAPPSFELFAAPGPRTPRTSPCPKPFRSFASRALCVAWPYASHWATPPPSPGMIPMNVPMRLQRMVSPK